MRKLLFTLLMCTTICVSCQNEKLHTSKKPQKIKNMSVKEMLSFYDSSENLVKVNNAKTNG